MVGSMGVDVWVGSIGVDVLVGVKVGGSGVGVWVAVGRAGVLVAVECWLMISCWTWVAEGSLLLAIPGL